MIRQPVDFEQFEKVTNGRGSLKKDLQEWFFINIEESIAFIDKCIERSEEDGTWKNAVEDIINFSKCFGAQDLGGACVKIKERYNDNYKDAAIAKQIISIELQKLKSFIKKTGN